MIAPLLANEGASVLDGDEGAAGLGAGLAVGTEVALQQGREFEGLGGRPVSVYQGLQMHPGKELGDEAGHLPEFDGAQVAQQLLEGRVVGLQQTGELVEQLGDGAGLGLVLPVADKLLLDLAKAGRIRIPQGAVAEDHVEQQRLLVGKAAEVDGKAPLMGINLVAKARELRRVGEGVEVIREQFHGQTRHGDVTRALDRMFAVDGDIKAALGHAELMLMQVPEPETGPVDEAGRHVGGQRRQTGVEAGADEGVGRRQVQGGIRFTLLPADLLGLADALDAVGCLVPAGEAIRARFRGLDGHPQVVGGQLGEEAPDQRLIELAHHVVAVEQIVRPVAEQVEHEAGDGVEGPAPLLEAEGGFQHAALLLIAPGLHPAPLDELQIAKQGGDDLVHMLKPKGGEAKAHAKVLEVGAADAAAGGELIDPASPLEQGEQAAFPLIADEVAQEGEGFFVVILIHARQREGQRQLAGLLDRGQLDANAEIIEPIERMAQYRRAEAAIRNGTKEAITPGQLGLDGCR